jgi:hypothetical protein
MPGGCLAFCQYSIPDWKRKKMPMPEPVTSPVLEQVDPCSDSVILLAEGEGADKVWWESGDWKVAKGTGWREGSQLPIQMRDRRYGTLGLYVCTLCIDLSSPYKLNVELSLSSFFLWRHGVVCISKRPNFLLSSYLQLSQSWPDSPYHNHGLSTIHTSVSFFFSFFSLCSQPLLGGTEPK